MSFGRAGRIHLRLVGNLHQWQFCGKHSHVIFDAGTFGSLQSRTVVVDLSLNYYDTRDVVLDWTAAAC
jgi:hypothetical protein